MYLYIHTSACTFLVCMTYAGLLSWPTLLISNKLPVFFVKKRDLEIEFSIVLKESVLAECSDMD